MTTNSKDLRRLSGIAFLPFLYGAFVLWQIHLPEAWSGPYWIGVLMIAFFVDWLVFRIWAKIRHHEQQKQSDR